MALADVTPTALARYEAMRTGVSIARPGGAVGRVGVPQEETIPNAHPTFYSHIIAGGPAPVRAYIEELLPDVLAPDRTMSRLRSRDEYRRCS